MRVDRQLPLDDFKAGFTPFFGGRIENKMVSQIFRRRVAPAKFSFKRREQAIQNDK